MSTSGPGKYRRSNFTKMSHKRSGAWRREWRTHCGRSALSGGRVSRRHPKRRMRGKFFAAIPVEVLTSVACRTLPAYAVRVLLAVAAQYRGNNNGDLALTFATA